MSSQKLAKFRLHFGKSVDASFAGGEVHQFATVGPSARAIPANLDAKITPETAKMNLKNKFTELQATRQAKPSAERVRHKASPVKNGSRQVIGASRSVIRLSSIALPLVLLKFTAIVFDSAKALHITSFRVPAYVPITLPHNSFQPIAESRHPLELSKPILFDCDYDYKPDEDMRITVRWFRNKEAEPFYQWLPELNERHFADWIRPLLNQTFVADPHDPLKRYRSLLINRLSMNLTGHYTCLVSSLAGQDMRQGSLVVYQPPRSFTFEHRIFPPPAPLRGPSPRPASFDQKQIVDGQMGFNKSYRHRQELLASSRANQASPTQFKSAPGNFSQSILLRPPNNSGEQSQAANNSIKIVYTHDGRPIRRKSKRQTIPIASWMSKSSSAFNTVAGLHLEPRFAIQLHHFQCHASQVTPRPVIVQTVKRGADSIAQYLHESSSVSIRPYQVSHNDYFESMGKPQQVSNQNQNASQSTGQLDMHNDTKQNLFVTLYDITVSTTVALNVSLPSHSMGSNSGVGPSNASDLLEAAWSSGGDGQLQSGVNTILNFRRGQRMSFECHLEITGTDYEQRKRINIDEAEVYQFAQAEERSRRLILQQGLQQNQELQKMTISGQEGTTPGFGSNLFLSNSCASSLAQSIRGKLKVLSASFIMIFCHRVLSIVTS